MKEHPEKVKNLSHQQKMDELDELFENLNIQQIVLQIRKESQRTYCSKKYRDY